MNRKYFGTDGIRGPFGGPVINYDFVARLAYAAGRWLQMQGTPGGVLIGRDTRASGVILTKAVACGLQAAGRQALDLGILPTPAVAQAVVSQRASLGVVITASHNSASDNGIKFFSAAGLKLPDVNEREIEELLPDTMPTAEANVVLAGFDARGDYALTMQTLLPAGSLSTFRIMLDTANGATCETSPAVLRHFGAEVGQVGFLPDGHNINAGVGSEHPELLVAAVKSSGAHIGIARDGDGDRCILCDETGAVLDGDEILAILGVDALRRGKLRENLLVCTIQSNLGLDAAIEAAGGRVLRTGVGDRYVIEGMLADGAYLGGESSGHIICREVHPTGDGLVAALAVLRVMVDTGKPLSALRQVMQRFPQGTRNVIVRNKIPLEHLPAVQRAVLELGARLGKQGRVLARYSGTEPKLRLLVEGPDERTVEAGLANLERTVLAYSSLF